jgi:hypothetical protein
MPTAMHSTIPFDTLAYAKKLIAAGVPEKQAEIQAETLAEVLTEQIVSKQFLDLRLREMEMRLTLRFGAMIATSSAVVVALIKLM